MNGWMDAWMDGWMDGLKRNITIIYKHTNVLFSI